MAVVSISTYSFSRTDRFFASYISLDRPLALPHRRKRKHHAIRSNRAAHLVARHSKGLKCWTCPCMTRRVKRKALNFTEANHPLSRLIDLLMARGLRYEKRSTTTQAESKSAARHKAGPVRGIHPPSHSKETPCTTSNQ